MFSNVDISDDSGMELEELSWTELDYHANMPVVGCHAYVISDKGRTANVNPFTPRYNSMQVLIADTAVHYDCP